MISIHMTTARRFASGLTAKAIRSVLDQTYRDFELIICDDASEDGTESFLAEAAKADGRIKVFRNERNVNSVAISLGRCMLRMSPQAEYVTWMFDDNELRHDALERLHDALTSSPDCDFVFGVGRCHLKGGQIMKVGDRPEEFIREHVDRNATLVPNSGILLRRGVFDEYGWYDSSIILRRSCDWDLFRRIINGGAKFRVLEEELVDEYGELQSDSLRNAFTTTGDIMYKYCQLRDAQGWDVSLSSMLYHPQDRIPPGAWTNEELALMYHMFLEYFVSVGHTLKAFQFAERLDSLLPGGPFYQTRLREHARRGSLAEVQGLMGLYAGLVSGRSAHSQRSVQAALEPVEARAAALQARVQTLEGLLATPRHRLAEQMNQVLKRVPAVHRLAKTALQRVRATS